MFSKLTSTEPAVVEQYLREVIERQPDALVRMYLNEYVDLAADPGNPDYVLPTKTSGSHGPLQFMHDAKRVARIQAAADRLVQAVYGQAADYVALDPICPSPSRLVVMLVDDQREIEIHLSDAND